MAVARDRFPDDLGWRGVRVDGIEAPPGGDRRKRPPSGLASALEVDPAWKQIVPYLVLHDGPRIFLMQRTRAGGDARLHDRWSIGIGGHVASG